MAASRASREPSADPTSQLQSEQAQAESSAAQAPATSEQATEPAQAEPASPPLPERHTAVTPGPRAQRFQELFAQSLKRTLGKAGWENFKDCYPTVAKSSEGTLKQVQAQMVAKLGEKCEREFESIMVNRQVVPKLNELESLIAEAATRRVSSNGPEPTPPHLLPPSTILSAHLHPSLTHHSAELSARLSSTQSQNALLHEEVTRQRREIDELLAKLEGVEGDVRAANDALGGLVGELAKESREGEAVLKGKTA